MTPAWGRKSQPCPPRQPACPSSLVSLCLCSTGPHFQKSSVLPGGMIQLDLETCGLRKPYGRARQASHIGALAASQPTRCARPTGPGTAGSVRLGLQPSVTSDQLQSRLKTQVAFTLPLEKKAFLCETVDNAETDCCLQVI